MSQGVDQPGIGDCGRTEAQPPSNLPPRIVVESCKRLVQLRSRPFSVLSAQGVIAVPHDDHRGRHQGDRQQHRVPAAEPVAVLFVGNSYTFGRVDPVMNYNAAQVDDMTRPRPDLPDPLHVDAQSAAGIE